MLEKLPRLSPTERFIQQANPHKLAQIIDMDSDTVTVIKYPILDSIVDLENPARITTPKRSCIGVFNEAIIGPISKRIRTTNLTEPKDYQISIGNNTMSMKDYTFNSYIAAHRCALSTRSHRENTSPITIFTHHCPSAYTTFVTRSCTTAPPLARK